MLVTPLSTPCFRFFAYRLPIPSSFRDYLYVYYSVFRHPYKQMKIHIHIYPIFFFHHFQSSSVVESCEIQKCGSSSVCFLNFFSVLLFC